MINGLDKLYYHKTMPNPNIITTKRVMGNYIKICKSSGFGLIGNQTYSRIHIHPSIGEKMLLKSLQFLLTL